MELGTRRHCLNHDQSVLGFYFRWLGATPNIRRPSSERAEAAAHPAARNRGSRSRPVQSPEPEGPTPGADSAPSGWGGDAVSRETGRAAQLQPAPGRVELALRATPSSQVAPGWGEGHAACNLPRRWAPLATRVGGERSPRPPQAEQGRAPVPHPLGRAGWQPGRRAASQKARPFA